MDLFLFIVLSPFTYCVWCLINVVDIHFSLSLVSLSLFSLSKLSPLFYLPNFLLFMSFFPSFRYFTFSLSICVSVYLSLPLSSSLSLSFSLVLSRYVYLSLCVSLYISSYVYLFLPVSFCPSLLNFFLLATTLKQMLYHHDLKFR